MKKLVAAILISVLTLSIGTCLAFATDETETPAFHDFPTFAAQDLPKHFIVMETQASNEIMPRAYVEDFPVYYEEIVDVYGTRSTNNYQYRRFTYANSYSYIKHYSLLEEDWLGQKHYAVTITYTFY